MSDIDDRLRGIIVEMAMVETFEPDVFVSTIKQIFADGGYVPIGNDARRAMWLGGYMTGQEWYNRFVVEIGDDAQHCAPLSCTCDVLEAAQRASGIGDEE